MKTFAIMHRPKGSKTYTNHYHESDSGLHVATIHGDLDCARANKAKLAEADPSWEYAVFEMVEVVE